MKRLATYRIRATAWVMAMLNVAAFFAPPGKGAEPPPTLEAAWSLVAELSFNEAVEMFVEIGQRSPTKKREADYGQAIALLNASPIIARNIAEARLLLARVRDANPDDETGISAWFFLGRIEQSHIFGSPNYEAALEIYRALGEAHPTHWYGQAALVKQALIELTLASSPEERPTKIKQWAQRADAITYPEFRRNLDRVLVWACLFSEMPAAETLKHARHGAELGYPRADLQGVALIRVCLLAMEIGEKEIAIDAARRLVTEFPRHYHRQRMLDYLEQLTGEPAP